METNSHPEAVASTVKQGQYSPRKRKDTAPKVNPQLAIELFFQEMGRIEAYTKRIEDATSRKVQIDGKSLESAENRLKNVLSDFERHYFIDHQCQRECAVLQMLLHAYRQRNLPDLQ